jgi:chemotaxis protein histidine kinase CheA
MTASPPLNGHKRPTMPVLGDWRPATPEPVEEQRNPEPQPEPAQTPDLVAQAQAEAIRAKAWADAEAQRIAAEAAAKAELIKAEEEARRLRLINDRNERKDREAAAASEARIAESNRKRDEADRAREEASRQAAEQQQAEQEAAKEIEAADAKWRSYAIKFAIVCGIVSLPVQMSFFWNPHAPWMAAAPIMLEGAAWVVHRGARAAAVSKRPVWHYRTIVWLLACIAAGVNLYHGLHAFDPGTAVATAFASIAGPGVWDLHENGRLRKREGVPTRRERKAAEKAARAEAAHKAAEEERRTAEKAAAAKAAEEAAKQLAETRAAKFPKVWEHALSLAADLGETTVTEAIWKRAKLDVDGALPGESAEVFRMRNAAEARVEAARQKRPVNTLSKTTNAQRAIQTPRSGYRPTPPRRTKGDTPRYNRAAGRAHGDLLRTKNAAKKDQS